MSVYDSRYRKVAEDLTPPTLWNAAASMTIFEIRRGLRGTWPKVPLVLGGFIIFGFLIQLTQIEALAGTGEEFWKGITIEGFDEDEPGIIGIQPAIATLLRPMDGPGSLIIIHIAIISAGLISGDLRDQAIELYFSKISLKAYFLAKIFASMALTFIGIPGFTLFYFFVVLYKRWPPLDEFLFIGDVFIRMMIVIVITTIIFSILILVFSSITNNPVNSGVLFVVFTLASRVIFESILYEATQIDVFYVLAPTTALDVIRRAILSPDEISDQFTILAIFALLGYFIGCLMLVYYRLRREHRQ